MNSPELDSSDEARTRRIARFASLGGALTGGALAAFLDNAGGVIGGAVFGEVVNQVASAVVEQKLTARQDRRVSEVLFQAAALLPLLHVEGLNVRDDGFFQGERSDGEEIIEGVLLAAKSSYEEKKVEFLGNMLATIACSESIDRPTANYMIRRVETLSWLHLVVMALIANKDEFPLPAIDLAPVRDAWSHRTATYALVELRDDLRLLSFPHDYARRKVDLLMSSLELTPEGNLLVHSLRLSTIPTAELRSVYEHLVES